MNAVYVSSLRNSANFIGARPVIVDRRIVQGERLILETCCPEKLPEYEETIARLEYEGTIKP
ncbi:MAG TPA: hypothetical protein VFW38_13040 [Solirubrobacteraceae bacterium]|nr:hypothetical protein [Solirubrobacteraceae bacterium]